MFSISRILRPRLILGNSIQTDRLPNSLELSLHQRHGRYEVVSSLDPVVHRCEDDHPTVHNDTPVHRLLLHGGLQGEESEDEDGDQEGHRGDVDRHAKAAKRPAAWWEGFAAEPLEQDAADGDEVGRDQGGDGEGDDGAEGHGGADVD